MAIETAPITVVTPAPITTIKATVKRSWKARIAIIVNSVAAFVLALVQYLQSVNLTNFGLTTERALFWMALAGLVQFLLLQWKPYSVDEVKAEPAPGGHG